LAGKYYAKEAAIFFAGQIKHALLRKAVSLTIAFWSSQVVIALFTFLSYALNPGAVIYDWLDANDKRPNSGYLVY
jgi:hypothetical protein